MKHYAELYRKIVYWSDEDNCYIGMCPELMYGGVHGDNQIEVFKELCEVVEEWIEILEKDGKPLPTPKNIESLQFA
jgi:predicted RNase H-like HicB family nuclease